mmetsp:Transcript_26489/g.79140  ORF Transcript_26489/g.79140 Transcript_26489/m.79140 type:complete len:245 (+) Transcript_26489:452-1186(+)
MHTRKGTQVLMQRLQGKATSMFQHVVAALLRQVPRVVEHRELRCPNLRKLLQAVGQAADELVEEMEQVEESIVHQQGHASLAYCLQDTGCRREWLTLRALCRIWWWQTRVLLPALEERVEVKAMLPQEPQGLQVRGKDLAVLRPEVELVRAEFPTLTIFPPADTTYAQLQRQEAGYTLCTAPEVLAQCERPLTALRPEEEAGELQVQRNKFSCRDVCHALCYCQPRLPHTMTPSAHGMGMFTLL